MGKATRFENVISDMLMFGAEANISSRVMFRGIVLFGSTARDILLSKNRRNSDMLFVCPVKFPYRG